MIEEPDDARYAQIRARYLEGQTTNELAKVFRISKATVMRLCKDLAGTRRLRLRERRGDDYAARSDGGDRRANSYALSDEEVIEIRRTIRAERKPNLPIHARKYRVTISAISSAARGKNFAHLNAIEPPITDEDIFKPTPKQKPISPHWVDILITMRRQDPKTWTYQALATWLNERTGKSFRGGPIKTMMARKDPTIVELETIVKPTVRVLKPRPTVSLREFKDMEKSYERHCRT